MKQAHMISVRVGGRPRFPVSVGIAIVAAILLAAGAWTAATPRARVVKVEGQGLAEVQRQGRGPWLGVTRPPHRLLYASDHLRTQQQTYATVHIDGAQVRLAPRTEVVIPPQRPGPAPRGLPRMMLIAGKIFLWLIGTRGMEIGTEGAVAAASGTKLLVEVDARGITTLTVLESQAIFYNDLGSVVVHAGEQSTAGPRMAPTRPIRVDPSGYIEWEASLDNVSLGVEVRYHPGATAMDLEQMLAQATRETAADDPAGQMALGDILNDLGDLQASELAYRQAASLAPGDAEPQLRLGACLLQQGRRQEALTTFEAAARLAPDSPLPLIGTAAAQAMSMQPDTLAEAERTIAGVLDQQPDNALALTVAGLIAIRRGDAVTARSALDRAIALEPGMYQAHAYRSAVCLADRDPAAALASANQAVRLAPTSALAHESLGAVHFFSGSLAQARAEAKLALQANPNSAAAHLLLSDVLVAEGNLQDGMQEAQAAVALDPLLAPAWSALGMLFLADNSLPQAERAFARALELSPQLVAARTGMGVTYARQGRLAQAMEAQRAAIALDSSLAAAHNNLGAIYLSLGDLEQAVAHFKTAIAAQPRWSLPHANLALAYLDLNRFADAVREGELAVRLGEDSARTHTTLARVYLKQNRTNRAWAALRRAVELDENYALAHFELAEVYLRQGRPREALNQQLEAISKQPSAMLEGREYARTEVGVLGPDAAISVRSDGRGDRGNNSYFVNASFSDGDNDRPHTDYQRLTGVAIAGRQTTGDRTGSLYVSAQREERDRPGRALAGGLPENPDWSSTFTAAEAHLIGRSRTCGDTALTYKVGYRSSTLRDRNPNSLTAGDPRPFRLLELHGGGALAELRIDAPTLCQSKLIAGAALSDEGRSVSGILGQTDPGGGPPTWTPFADSTQRRAATLYAEHETRLCPRTRFMVGGRMASREGMKPVWRPKAWVKHDLPRGGTLVALTRPLIADDVSELAPVDHWSLGDTRSPLDFALGGFGQSYELQYQLLPRDGSLLRLSAFHHTMRNVIIDLQDPAWAGGVVGEVVGSADASGAEVEYERWLGRDLSGGLLVRYTTSNNDETGRDVPYVPQLLARLRLDYLDPLGYRVGASWTHVGRRYADFAASRELGSYGVLDLSVARQLDLHTDVFVGVENVFDRRYGFWEGYPEPGRRIQMGVLYRF